MSIFDLIVSTQLVAYWEEMTADRAPYMTEELFPVEQKLGLKIDWIAGNKGTPKVLKLSAFDAKAVPRLRNKLDKLEAQMPFFKESKYIDEELRQQLNMVIQSNNQALIDSIIMHIFDDEISLIEGATARRELMRMQLLTTGVVTIESNGQAYAFDYQMPEENKVTVDTDWSNPDADIMGDIRTLQKQILDATGVKPTRAMCDEKTWGYILNNNAIKKSIFVLSDGQAFVSDGRLEQYLMTELGLKVVRNSARYTDEDDKQLAYMPENTFVMFPEGQLGKTFMGTTPEESDLMTQSVANVAITEGGIAVTTMKIADPVQVETKVTMICLPSCPHINKVGIIDTKAA